MDKDDVRGSAWDRRRDREKILLYNSLTHWTLTIESPSYRNCLELQPHQDILVASMPKDKTVKEKSKKQPSPQDAEDQILAYLVQQNRPCALIPEYPMPG
jgi:hypothetical protein